MHSTNYIIRFILILTAFVAVVLAFLSTGLKPIHDRNEALYNKRAILEALGTQLDNSDQKLDNNKILEIFKNQIQQQAIDAKGNLVDESAIKAKGYPSGLPEDIDMAKEEKLPLADRIYPVYIYTKSNGEKIYIVSVRGKGLWDAIWGNIAIKDDLRTIAGVSFDHKGETPGLGAEIKDNASWKQQFVGKTFEDKEGHFTSVKVVKGGAKNDINEVDGISGATITGEGVNKMLNSGLAVYIPYFNHVEKK